MVGNEMVSPELYPFKSNYLTIDGLKYHYLDEGEGEPVVMVHGNPTWSFYFRNLVKALGPGYRKIVPDHIGCGLSSKPKKEEYSFRLADRVDNLEQLIQSLNLGNNITLVVHDWGGMIGLTWALRHPERVKRLVIMNTAGFHLPQGKRFPASLRLCRDSKLGAALVLGANAFTRTANRFCVTKTKLPRAVKDAYLAPHPHWQDRLAILRFVQDIPLRPGDPSFSLVTETQSKLKRFRKIPTLILWGAQDFIFDDHFLNEWRDYLPEADVHRFADAGHYILEDAFDDCLSHIQTFFAKNPVTTH